MADERAGKAYERMQIDLSGCTALVTGSTAGIGFATARQLAECGARVVVNGRTKQRVNDAVDALRSVLGDRSGALEGTAADVGTADGVAELTERWPDVDVLVNNAAAFTLTPFEQISDEAWQQYWDLNVMSGVRLARHHVPRMVSRGWGRVVFVSSESGLHIPPEMVHYGVTKAAVIAAARGIAESYPASGVTVNSVLPGPTRSEGFMQMMQNTAKEQGVSVEQAERDMIATARPTSLLGRAATPDEVANMIVYVCSPQASATVGAALRVDGGVVRAIP